MIISYRTNYDPIRKLLAALNSTPCETIDEELSFFFEDYFDVVAVNYTDDGLEEYVGYKGSDFNEDELRRSAEAMGIALPPYTKEFLESKTG